MTTPRESPPDRIGLNGAVMTAGLNIVLPPGKAEAAFVAAACVFWFGYAVVRAWGDRTLLRTWGFRADNLAAPAAASAAAFVLGAAGLAGYAAVFGGLRFPVEALLLLFALYPLFGLVQQFLVLGVVVNELERMPSLRARPAIIVVAGAALFAAVHAYRWPMVPATFLLELAVIPMYLRWRNLWPFGVLHGWLGALFWLWVLGEDPWAKHAG